MATSLNYLLFLGFFLYWFLIDAGGLPALKRPKHTKDLRTFQSGEKKTCNWHQNVFPRQLKKANERCESEASGVNTKNCPY